jgi:alkanesulfonate monooxygenase SsuD/methylene tetrahydromethanopterin reductase-like flavin-dependent oxidoreductase (luciferase family)
MPSAIRFGLFDWLDESGRAIGDTYAERLQVLERADRAGFYCYHLAEHHATELSTVPSPNVFLASAAQRTRQLRLGPLSVILPLYDPVRLLEEICMLDQLSQGRFELGLSRGSTGEHIGGDPDRARAMFDEALTVILMGLTTGAVDFHGTHYDIGPTITRLAPVQRPYPPLWYPTSNVDSIPWIARHGINTAVAVHLAPSFDHTAAMLGRYRSELATHAGDPERLNAHVHEPLYGFSLHIHVAETDELARRQAKPAFERFMHNFTYRFVRRGQPNRYADRGDFDAELDHGRLAVGSPATVRRQLQDYLDRSGANYVLGCFTFGSLPVEQILASVDLFARQVMPALSPRAALAPAPPRAAQ